MKNETVLVYGGTGAQGGAIVRALIANGHKVRALTRSEKNADVIKSAGAVPAYADLDDLASLQRASNGCDAVILTLPLAFDISTVMDWADNVIKAAQDAGIKYLVFNASGPIPEDLTGVAAVDIKLFVAEKLAQSGLPVVTIQPTLYMGNMAAPWSAPAIYHQGTLAYPLPEDQKVSWISWESMTEFVAAAVEKPELAGQSFNIGGPEALSGTDIANIYTNHLAKPVSYFSVALNDFEDGLNHALGEPVGTEIAKLYKWFSTDGAASLQVDNTEITHVLGVTPESINDWVKSVDWRHIASPASS